MEHFKGSSTSNNNSHSLRLLETTQHAGISSHQKNSKKSQHLKLEDYSEDHSQKPMCGTNEAPPPNPRKPIRVRRESLDGYDSNRQDRENLHELRGRRDKELILPSES